MTDNNQNQEGKMEESRNTQEDQLQEPVRVPASAVDTGNPCQDACAEIMARIRQGGIPITINPSQIGQESEITGISKFIKDSRIIFNVYKRIMDEILNCGLGDLGDYKNKRVYVDPCDTDYIRQERSDEGLTSREEPENKRSPQYKTSTHLLSADEKANFRSGALFSSSKAYSILKYATEKFVHLFYGLDPGDIPNPPMDVLPYVALIEAKLRDTHCPDGEIRFRPLFAELIWSYWNEEGMLVLTMQAIAKRFQNKKLTAGKDPLANLTLDPLRPLSNLIWGYIQDTEANHLLTTRRRAFEYDHQYGLSLFAGGGFKLNSAESRSLFIQAFHNLLYRSAMFYNEADNLFKVPDAFPVLNALREVHLLLAEGAHNQFGDLPITARAEMMMEQYILSRSEIREFLGSRVMVPYEEAWMDKVDTLKSLLGWPGASITYYRDLAVFGEMIILSIRWISWSQINNRDFAKDWALTFRNEIQRYIHCYHAVTGVDLSAPEVSSGQQNQKALMPAMLIRQKAQRDLMMRR
jgi:hypothetical protein